MSASSGNRFQGQPGPQVLKVMKKHRTHTKLQLDALVYFTQNMGDPGFVNPLKEVLQDDDGKDQDVLSECGIAMRQHGNDANVQLYGCIVMALLGMQVEDKVKERSLQQGLPAILAALRSHPGNSGVQAYGIMALTAYTTGSDVAAQWLLSNDALHTIVAALYLYTQDLFIAQNSLSWVSAMSKAIPVFTAFKQQLDRDKFSDILARLEQQCRSLSPASTSESQQNDIDSVRALIHHLQEVHNIRYNEEAMERASIAMKEYKAVVDAATRGKVDIGYGDTTTSTTTTTATPTPTTTTTTSTTISSCADPGCTEDHSRNDSVRGSTGVVKTTVGQAVRLTADDLSF